MDMDLNNRLTEDETLEQAYDIFLELAADNLDPADVLLFNLQFEERGGAELFDPAEDWLEHVDFDLNPDFFAEVVIGLADSEDGEINHFDTIAENIISDSIASIQLAPDGIVTDIYPANGIEAGKIDLLHDKDRKEISCYARDHHTIITQGPFELKQGGLGIAVRNPVYLKDENGQEYFWGFTIVILRIPDIFSDSIDAISNFGYEYRLSKTDTPWSDTYTIIEQSDGEMLH